MRVSWCVPFTSPILTQGSCHINFSLCVRHQPRSARAPRRSKHDDGEANYDVLDHEWGIVFGWVRFFCELKAASHYAVAKRRLSQVTACRAWSCKSKYAIESLVVFFLSFLNVLVFCYRSWFTSRGLLNWTLFIQMYKCWLHDSKIYWVIDLWHTDHFPHTVQCTPWHANERFLESLAMCTYSWKYLHPFVYSTTKWLLSHICFIRPSNQNLMSCPYVCPRDLNCIKNSIKGNY